MPSRRHSRGEPYKSINRSDRSTLRWYDCHKSQNRTTSSQNYAQVRVGLWKRPPRSIVPGRARRNPRNKLNLSRLFLSRPTRRIPLDAVLKFRAWMGILVPCQAETLPHLFRPALIMTVRRGHGCCLATNRAALPGTSLYRWRATAFNHQLSRRGGAYNYQLLAPAAPYIITSSHPGSPPKSR